MQEQIASLTQQLTVAKQASSREISSDPHAHAAAGAEAAAAAAAAADRACLAEELEQMRRALEGEVGPRIRVGECERCTSALWC